jgi:hypothetical protein
MRGNEEAKKYLKQRLLGFTAHEMEHKRQYAGIEGVGSGKGYRKLMKEGNEREYAKYDPDVQGLPKFRPAPHVSDITEWGPEARHAGYLMHKMGFGGNIGDDADIHKWIKDPYNSQVQQTWATLMYFDQLTKKYPALAAKLKKNWFNQVRDAYKEGEFEA